WQRAASKLRRPWSSIVLEKGIKDTLLTDARDFLASQAWYVQRGIPYRRGYLLHGVPGSGKTSLIHALSGELGLDIYVISLSRRTMDDQALNDIVNQLPPQCIALMEDIDCAFKKGITARSGADDSEDGEETVTPKESTAAAAPNDPGAAAAGSITLSGLLNAIDGVAAHEGRLLFATTNVREALDPALIRPGRMDVVLEFRNASREQAEELFKCFYPPDGTPVLQIDSLPTAGGCQLTREARDLLASRFAALLPERELSMAALQGYLMLHKVDAAACVDGVEEWVRKER
ncbi:P-loop containing nucleoside triphosphate hydrolase protein, partial [Dacryopinax primogenitus]